MKGLKVKCPNCSRVMWETTDLYDPDKTPNGSMVQLLPLYRKNRWPTFGDGVMISSASTPMAEMDCPNCLAPIVVKGKLRIDTSASVIEPEPEKKTSGLASYSDELMVGLIPVEEKVDEVVVEETVEEKIEETVVEETVEEKIEEVVVEEKVEEKSSKKKKWRLGNAKTV